MHVLLEVFPPYSVEKTQWVLAKAQGDLEEVVQMLVKGKEEGPPAWNGPNQDLPRCFRGPRKDELKSFILQKYMMVDRTEDQKIYSPCSQGGPQEADPIHQQPGNEHQSGLKMCRTLRPRR